MEDIHELIKAKIPCKETGIEIKHTMCDICTPGPQCGVDAYVRNGVIIKLEGTKGFPSNQGKLCTKGASGRQYLYRDDRIRNPLRRTGRRGSGEFEEISWDKALDICAEQFLKIRKQYGPEAVAWMTGYSKWLRPWLHRLTHSFGSLNYLTESSACHCAEVMSYKTLFGVLMQADIRNTDMLISWGSNSLINAYPRGRGMMGMKARGGKIVTIDPRYTQIAQKLSDLYLRPRIGTDGTLAHAMAKIIIEEDQIDHDFIEKYVHGFEEYKELVKGYSLDKAENITGVPKADIMKTVELFMESPKSVIVPGNGLTHRTDGYNMHRAILSLMVITGKVDRPGTFLPEREVICHSAGGFPSHETEFFDMVKPQNCRPAVGALRFPLWSEFIPEGQGMDLVRQICTADPYPIKSLACFGVNNRMYPDSPAFLQAFEQLDFVMATDIFMTEVCRHADIVLPVSTSYERSEVKCYGDRLVNYTRPAIPPVYNNRDDVSIIADLAKRMHLNDELLEAGYEEGVKFILQESGIEDWEAVKDAPLPVPAPNAVPYKCGSYLEGPISTPSGKIELYSEVVAKYRDKGLNPLPVLSDSDGGIDTEEYPFTMMSGARIPTALHTRTTKSSWLRSQTNDPALEINPADADKLGIREGDRVRVSTPTAEIVLNVRVTEVFAPGEVGMFHGFEEANANDLIDMNHLDPYSGFPGYKQFRCKISKVVKAED